MRARTLWFACVLCISLFHSTSAVLGAKRPNILFILADDQDLVLSGLQPMQFVKDHLQAEGTTFTNWFASSPICCPSRAGMLTGRYAHNIRNTHFHDSFNCDVPSSTCGCMRMNTSGAFERHTFANLLSSPSSGYDTAYFGKYLNPPGMVPYCNTSSPKNPVPSGWDDYFGMCNTAYYNVTWNDNGKMRFTGDQPSNYTTSLVGNRTVEYIKSRATKNTPWMAVAAVRAPHEPFTPAPWYATHTVPVSNPSLPSYNFSAVNHLPYIAAEPSISHKEAAALEDIFEDRWRTLLSVDDLVKSCVEALHHTGQLEHTYVIYTSDHGFHLGEFRLPSGKTHPYDFDIRVPMVIRGPGVPKGAVNPLLAGHVDVAPTLLELAKTPYPPMDGRSVVSHLLEENIRQEDPINDVTSPSNLLSTLEKDANEKWRTAYLLEYYAVHDWPSHWHIGMRINSGPNNTYRALRILDGPLDKLYVEYTTVSDWFFQDVNFRGYFDVSSDPYQMRNEYSQLSPEEKSALAKAVEREWTCKGTTCA